MLSKKINTKNKIINHLTARGKKHTSEKIFLKTLKKLQKDSKKQSSKIFKLAIVMASPTFKLHTLKQKKRKKKKGKEIPAFISKTKIRISLAIKNILLITQKKKKRVTYLNLREEVLATAQKKSETIERKNTTQEQILTKKHLLRYYRWN